MRNKISESDKIYITDKLFSYNNKLYFDKEEKIIKLNKSNWNQYLKEYGWSRIELGWRNRLNIYGSGIGYGILDCGANGDCLFHCISEALNDPFDPVKCIYDIETIRKIASEEININNFITILENYKLEQETLEFNGSWNPEKIESIQELKDEICKIGDNFWGDHIILQLLQNALKFNVIILNSGDNLDDKFTVKPMASDIYQYPKTIILHYIEGLHFQLIGFFNNHKMNVLFDKNQIPHEILRIHNIDCRITN